MSLYRRMLEYTRPYVPGLLLAMAVMVVAAVVNESARETSHFAPTS